MRSLHLSHCFVPVLAFLFVLSGLSAYGQDEPTAAQIAEWRKHAVQGEAYTQYNLGIVLKHGKGAVKDEAEGVRWFRKAAEQGHASAQHNLGASYENGDGVVKNETEAYKWFLLSAAQGIKESKEHVPIIEKYLSPAQRTEGQRMAQEWEANFAKREANKVTQSPVQAATAGDRPKGGNFSFR